MAQDTPTAKQYSNGEVTIVWKPDLCIHSARCVNGLPNVFDPKARPWINAEGATTDKIVQQVSQCPSGALSYFMNDDSKATTGEATTIEEERIIEVIENGPLMVYGNTKVKRADGSFDKHHKTTALCRCGASQNKPYCDGSHRKVNFKG